MKKTLLPLLFLVGLTLHAQKNELSNKEFEFIQKLKKAESVVSSYTTSVKEQKAQVAKMKKIYDAAKFVITNFEKEVRIRKAFSDSQEFGRNRREKHLIKLEKRYDNLAKTLEDKHNNPKTSPAEKQRIIKQLGPIYSLRGKIQSQIVHLKRKTDFKGRQKRAQEKLATAKEKLKKAKVALRGPQDNYEIALEYLKKLEESLQKSVDAWAALRLQAGDLLKKLYPPYLEKVVVYSTDKSKIFYEASWQPEDERIKKKVEFYNKVITAQKKALKDMDRLRLSLAYMLDDKNTEWQKLNKKYIDLIDSEKWENILTELAASTVGVLWNSKGTITVNLFIEAGMRVSDAAQYAFGTSYLGYKKPDYGYPKISSGKTAKDVALDTASDIFSVSKLQSSLAALASGIVEDNKLLVKVLEENGAWTLFQGKLASVAGGSGEVIQKNFTDANYMKKFAFGSDNILKGSTQLRQLGANAFGNFMKGAAINAGKSLIKKYIFTSGQERIKVYKKMYIIDLEWKAIIQEINASHKREQIEKNKLTAANNERAKALKELDDAKLKRYFKKVKDEILKSDENKFVLELTFSSEIKELKVKLADKALTSTLIAPVIKLDLDIEGLPDLVNMKVSLKGKYTDKLLDSTPEIIPAFNTTTKSWKGYKPGEDTQHKFRLKPTKDGLSLVFLFDCSGSMNDNSKLVEAKAAAKKILKDKTLFKGKKNEIAVWCFINGYTQMVQGFTTDINAVISSIDKLSATGGTPLARSIVGAGNYLVSQGMFKRKALVVLSDGEDTEGGNPQYAIQLIKEKANTVRKEGW